MTSHHTTFNSLVFLSHLFLQCPKYSSTQSSFNWFNSQTSIKCNQYVVDLFITEFTGSHHYYYPVCRSIKQNRQQYLTYNAQRIICFKWLSDSSELHNILTWRANIFEKFCLGPNWLWKLGAQHLHNLITYSPNRQLILSLNQSSLETYKVRFSYRLFHSLHRNSELYSTIYVQINSEFTYPSFLQHLPSPCIWT